jgi:hypothetical protein
MKSNRHNLSIMTNFCPSTTIVENKITILLYCKKCIYPPTQSQLTCKFALIGLIFITKLKLSHNLLPRKNFSLRLKKKQLNLVKQFLIIAPFNFQLNFLGCKLFAHNRSMNSNHGGAVTFSKCRLYKRKYFSTISIKKK